MGRRFYHRKDANHEEIVDEIRREGLSAQNTQNAGDGFPDVVIAIPEGITITGEASALRALRESFKAKPIPGLVIHEGANIIVEIKDGERGKKDKRALKLRPKQVEWHATWKGPRVVCSSIDALYCFIGRARSGGKGETN